MGTNENEITVCPYITYACPGEGGRADRTLSISPRVKFCISDGEVGRKKSQFSCKCNLWTAPHNANTNLVMLKSPLFCLILKNDRNFRSTLDVEAGDSF